MEGWSAGVIRRWVVWIVGVGLILFGLLGIADETGVSWLVAGLIITPRTRRELFDLCVIWVEAANRE